MENKRLVGKIVIITGGTQGLGKSVCFLAANEGAEGIVFCGRNTKNGKNVEKDLRKIVPKSYFIKADLQKVSDCRKVVKFCDKIFGRVDGLVNAAGLTNRGSLENTTEKLWNLLFDVNTRAPFFLMQETVKVMRREKTKGSIINILSISAHGGQSFITPYCGAKAALGIITKNAAHSLRWDKIRVNGINMGWTYTDNEQKVQVKSGKPENWIEEAGKTRPFGRLLYPEDIGKLCIYLLSNDSEMMTGSIIDLDQQVVGGMD